MKLNLLPLHLLATALLVACHRNSESGDSQPSGQKIHLDAGEQAELAKLKPVKDPVNEEIYAAKLKTRQNYNSRRFEELEKQAAELRASKATYHNGSWKIVQFYDSLECDEKEPESMWQLHDKIHKEWIAAKPESITARVAYADFLTSYAWHARGYDYADKVTANGWKLFEERLAAAREVLVEAKALKETDPYWWRTFQTVALGQGWDSLEYEPLLADAHSHEPKFWGYDTARAHSLLPRWHGHPGDWETFAAETAARPDGLGIELYARIVIEQSDYYDNVFRQSKAAWPKTKEGLQVLLEKYPESLTILNEAAMLATLADDRAAAKEWFQKIGDRYLPSAWEGPEQFVHARHWANANAGN